MSEFHRFSVSDAMIATASKQHTSTRFSIVCRALIIAFLMVSTGFADEAAFGPEIPDFESVKSFLRAHCSECHGSEKKEGDVRFDHASKTISNADDAEHWQHVLDALNLGEMPPEESLRPANDELTATIDSLTRGLFETRNRLSSSSDIVERRLHRREYRNTVEELLGVPVPTSRLPEDDLFQGFDTVGQAQTMSALHINRYLEVAREALGRTLMQERLPSKITRFDADEREYRKMKKKSVDSLANKLTPGAKKPITDPETRRKVEESLAAARKRLAVTDTIPGVRRGFLMANPWSPSGKSENAAAMIPIPVTGWEGTLAAKGRYVARVRAGLTVAAPDETHFLEFHRVDRFVGKQLLDEYAGTVQIDSTIESPRVYEVPFEIDWIEIEGPLDMGVDGRQQILFRVEPGSSEADNNKYAREII